MAIMKPAPSSMREAMLGSCGRMGASVYVDRPEEDYLSRLTGDAYQRYADHQAHWDVLEQRAYQAVNYIESNAAYSDVAVIGFDDRIMTVDSKPLILQQEGIMRDYIMAHPQMKERWVEGTELYPGWQPSDPYVGWNNEHYARANSGIIPEMYGTDECPDELIISEYIEPEEDVLSFDDQMHVINTYRHIDELELYNIISEDLIYE